MKNNTKILIVVIAVLAVGAFAYYHQKNQTAQNQNPKTATDSSIKGCYVAHLSKDVYTLAISSQNGEAVAGTLSFKNFEKDSSSGTFTGTYKDGILLGDYSFQSEGMNSVMQVIFKKQGTDFVRGYGDLNATGDRFADVNKITYDSSAVFKISLDCASNNK